MSATDSTERARLREGVAHGSAGFPIRLYDVRMVGRRQVLPVHWHDEYEFLYMTRGGAMFQVDDDLVALAEGEAMLVEAGQLHSGFSPEMTPCEYYAIVLSPRVLIDELGEGWDLVEGLRCGDLEVDHILREGLDWQARLLAHLRALTHILSDHKPGHELEARGRLLMCFAELLAHGVRRRTSEARRQGSRAAVRLKAVVQYVHANSGSKLSLADLSAVAGLSSYHFCRFFRDVTGRTPTDYVNNYRVEQAALRLETTNASVTDIAFDCGFDNPSYFVKVFRRYMGQTPTVFRRAVLSGTTTVRTEQGGSEAGGLAGDALRGL